MGDTTHIIPHPDEERPLHELRSEFRADNLARIRSEFRGQHPLGWNMIGDPATARDKYTAEEWAAEMDLHLCALVTQDFSLSTVPSSLGVRVEKLAQESITHDLVSHPGGVEHDAPACDLASMTDDQVCAYVDAAIHATEEG
jgi:hypothetical protein